MRDVLYVEIDNLDIEWRKDSARGYDIDSIEFNIWVGEKTHYNWGQIYGREYLKENLDKVINTEAMRKAESGWGIGLKAYRVVTVAWMNPDGGLHNLGKDWAYTDDWEEEVNNAN